MESKFFRYKYDWYQLNILVQCTKCGNHIVFQDAEGYPTCNECGNVHSLTWEHNIKEMDIIGMRRGGSDHKIMMGTIQGNVRVEKKDHINCYSCKHPIELPDQDEPIGISCKNCTSPLSFKIFDSMSELVFYKSGNSAKANANSVQPIAVRCVSCGGPLEVDPTKNNFTCKFCSTENILPPSLRYKVSLDDVYVAIRNSKYLKLAAFETNGEIVEQALRENGKASFEDNELDEILLKNKNDISIYRQIIDEFTYLPSDKILKEIFSTSNSPTVIYSAGIRLQKSNEEINAQIDTFTPLANKTQQRLTSNNNNKLPKNQPSKTNTKFKSPFFIILLLVFIITLFLMINSFIK